MFTELCNVFKYLLTVIFDMKTVPVKFTVQTIFLGFYNMKIYRM